MISDVRSAASLLVRRLRSHRHARPGTSSGAGFGRQAGCDSFGPHDAEVLRIRTMPELSLPELHVYDSSPCYHGRDGAKFEQSIPLLSATLKLWARTGPTTRYRSRLVTGSRFQAIGLGAMFMRDAISPIEVVGCVTFPQEPGQSDSTNRAFAERRCAVR